MTLWQEIELERALIGRQGCDFPGFDIALVAILGVILLSYLIIGYKMSKNIEKTNEN